MKVWSLRFSSGVGWGYIFERDAEGICVAWLEDFVKNNPGVQFILSHEKPKVCAAGYHIPYGEAGY